MSVQVLQFDPDEYRYTAVYSTVTGRLLPSKLSSRRCHMQPLVTAALSCKDKVGVGARGFRGMGGSLLTWMCWYDGPRVLSSMDHAVMQHQQGCHIYRTGRRACML